jgi:hypothetical protein
MQKKALEKQNIEHAIQLRLAAHVAISLLMNGRLSIDTWKPLESGSLDRVWAVRNYNFIVQTYFDYLCYPRDSIERPLKQAILYIGFLLGPDQQRQAYVNFLLTVSDTKDLNTLGLTTRLYFDDELCLLFMQALAEQGIDLVLASGELSSSNPD